MRHWIDSHKCTVSLLGHFYDTDMLILERNLNTLCVWTTWFHLDKLCFFFIDFSNYSVHRCDAGRGVGISIYVRVTHKTYRHLHGSAESFDYFENVFRGRSLKKKSLFTLGDLNKPDSKLIKIIRTKRFEQGSQKTLRHQLMY